jgi:PAS domain S-box-containing protein
VDLAVAHQRLRELNEISKLLVDFESVEQTIPAVVAIMGSALSVRVGMLTEQTSGVARTVLWHVDSVGRHELATATSRLRATHDYFLGDRVAPAAEPQRGISEGRPDDGNAARKHQRFILLPLATARRGTFGVIELAGNPAALSEDDLNFANAVSNQLALALDRQSAIDAKQANAEAGRRSAEEGQVRAHGFEVAANASRVEAEWSRDVATAQQAAAELGQAAAEDLRERYEALVDNIDHAFVWELDPRTMRATYVSARAEVLLGHPRQRWLEEAGLFIASVHPEDRSLVVEAFGRAVSDKQDQRVDHRAVDVQGRVIWLHTGVHAAQADRNAPRLQGVSLDITPTKEASERVRVQLEFTRAVAGSLGEGVIAIDLDGRITLFNDAAGRLLGVSEENALGKPAHEIVHIRCPKRAPLPHAESPFALVLEKGETIRSDEQWFDRVGGTAFPVGYTAAALKHAGGMTGAVLVFQDIMSVKRAEREQRVLADVSAALVSSVGNASTLEAIAPAAVPLFADLAVVDERSSSGAIRRRKVSFADRGERMAELHDRLMHEEGQHVKLPTRAVLFSNLSTSAMGDLDDATEGRALRSLGVRSMIAVPLYANGEILGGLTFALFGTERRYDASDLALAEEIARRAALAVHNARLYEQAQRATRARADVLEMVSHDLKNPLSVILMSLQSLSLTTQPAGDAMVTTKSLERIKRAAEQMDRLIRDLLDSASIEAGTLSVVRMPLEAGPLVAGAIDAARSRAASKTIRLENRLPIHLPLVSADAGRIQQVLTNLIDNAVKFTGRGGSVTVRADVGVRLVEFAVSDTGCGISQENVARIFDRYWQAGATARLGSGLGLTISKGIVDAHGGRMWVESELGAGTTFFFTLPCAP